MQEGLVAHIPTAYPKAKKGGIMLMWAVWVPPKLCTRLCPGADTQPWRTNATPKHDVVKGKSMATAVKVIHQIDLQQANVQWRRVPRN